MAAGMILCKGKAAFNLAPDFSWTRVESDIVHGVS